MRAAVDELADVVGRLAELVPAGARGSLDALVERLSSGRLRVLVVGEAKRGKSTVVNALLGRAVLPMGVTPLTAVATTVTYGGAESAEVVALDGGVAAWVPEDLDAVVTERGNPGNRRGVAAVTVRVPAPLLARGVEVVATPGTGSVYAHNTAAAERALPTMDAAVLVLTADPPKSAAERELLTRVRASAAEVFVLLNKADRLDAAELAEALAFTRRAVTEPPARGGTDVPAPPDAPVSGGVGMDVSASPDGGFPDGRFPDGAGAEAPAPPDATLTNRAAQTDVRVYPVAARRALDGGDPGFAAFVDAFTSYVDVRRDADLRRSVVRQARDVAVRLLDEVRVTRHASAARTDEAVRRVAAFRDRLGAVGARRRDAADRADAERRRVLAELNAAAAAEVRELTVRTDAEVRAYLAELPGGLTPAEITRRGRAHLVAQTGAAVEEWRERQRTSIEARLALLDARLAAELARELDEVRGLARDLLDLDLSMPPEAGRLLPDRRFFYSTAEDVDQLELLAGAIRRRVPGEMGRRLARERLLREVPDLVDRRLGRARADLQARLAASVHALVRAVDDRHAAGIGRLTTALDTADRHRRQDAKTRRTADADLSDREAHLRDLLTRLAAADPDAPPVADEERATAEPPGARPDAAGPPGGCTGAIGPNATERRDARSDTAGPPGAGPGAAGSGTVHVTEEA